MGIKQVWICLQFGTSFLDPREARRYRKAAANYIAWYSFLWALLQEVNLPRSIVNTNEFNYLGRIIPACFRPSMLRPLPVPKILVMSVNKIYRPSAIIAKQTEWLGDTVLLRPISFSFLTAFAMILAIMVMIFLFYSTYTKRSTVTGQLIPDLGLVKVYVPQPGVVLQKRVVEGQAVKQGDVLYVLSSERQSSTQGNIQAGISS